VIAEPPSKEKSEVNRVPPVTPVPPVIVEQRQKQQTESRPKLQRPLPFISPPELQVKGESTVLFGTLAVAASIFLFVTLTTALVFGLLVLIAYFGIKSHQANLRRTAFRVTAQTAPEIDALIQTAARRLTMPTPELFIVEDRELNAFATGFDGLGTVVLNSALVKAMSSDELMFIIGHELTHIKCGHCKYSAFTNATVGTIVNHGIALLTDMIFKLWSRKAEFTCDRGGLVACKRPDAAMSALAKLEILDPVEARKYIDRAVRSNPSVDDWFATHPDTNNRIAAIANYAKTRDYFRLQSLWES
jgi:Zn-dependent protease with chaperone function